MIEQVRLIEVAPVAGDARHVDMVFAFGTHPLAAAAEVHAVTNAAAEDNILRIIIDELLRGNNLEELECRGVVDEDEFSRVPLGATPDDVARCAGAQDVLAARCPASNPLSLCICKNAGGCTVTNSMPTIQVPQGAPLGILDSDRDGAADATQFIRGAVGLTCGAFDVVIDVMSSYWTPSGNQQKPAQGGFNALGPAIVLVPANALPTGTTCTLKFSSDVVDKDGQQVCAPANGNVTAGCTPGDTSAFQFTVEPLQAFALTATPDGQSRTADVSILFNAPLRSDAIGAGITVTEAPGTDYTQFTVLPGAQPDQITIHWTAAGGLAPGTRYTITVPTTVTDAYGQALKQSTSFTFTTGS